MHELLGKKTFFNKKLINHQGVIICKRNALFSDLFAASGLIRRSYIKYFQFQILCSSKVFLFILSHIAFLFFDAHCFPSVLPIIVGHRPKMCAPTFPQSSSLYTVNARGAVISLAAWWLFELTIPLGRRNMFINL